MTTKLSTPQFVLLTEVVSPNAHARLNMTSEGWIGLPDHFRADVANALVRRGLVELLYTRGCPYMRPTEAGKTLWNEINTALRAK